MGGAHMSYDLRRLKIAMLLKISTSGHVSGQFFDSVAMLIKHPPPPPPLPLLLPPSGVEPKIVALAPKVCALSSPLSSTAVTP